MKKTFKVVMLPTKEKATDNNSPLFLYPDRQLLRSPMGNQHLYIISTGNKEQDDEIKEGDFYINRFNQIHQASDINLTSQEEWNTCKKIVATTDKLFPKNKRPDLGAMLSIPLPQLPESFINAYIKAYNEGKPITEVDLEMDNDKEYWGARNQFNSNSIDFKVYSIDDKVKYEGVMFDYYPIKIKTRPDNTVIVHQSKMYSRDEVIQMLNKFELAQTESGINIVDYVSKNACLPIPSDEWISRNL